MKTKLPFVVVVAILVSACTTGSYMTKNYDDGIYFNPGDVPPVTAVTTQAPTQEKSAQINKSDASNQQIIMSQMDKNPDGSTTLNNSIYQPDQNNTNTDQQSYNMDNQQLAESDTTKYYNDDDVKYVINNYYDGSDNVDFGYRLGRFYNPYSPFYDDWYYGYNSPWYSGYYGMNMGFGWDSWGYGYPGYYGYYSPFSFGLGGYWGLGYGGYYDPYYSGYYGGGYYGGYYGGNYGFGGKYNDRQLARRRSTNMNVPGGGSGGSFGNNTALSGRSSNLKAGNTANQANSSNPNTWTENGHVRSRSIDASASGQDVKNATIVNDRRGSTNADGTRTSNQVQGNNVVRSSQMVRPGTTTTSAVRRTYAPSTTGRTYSQQRVVSPSQNYTPSYNKPRIVNQSNYNSNTYTRPRTVDNSSGRQVVRSANSQTYTMPRSSSSVRQTYRSGSSYSTGSSSSYQRSSSSSYSAPARSSSSGSYSAPARSSSSGSYSGGNSGGGSSAPSGNSGGGGGGGGSGHRR